ncbi:MAG: hypothetical protein ABIS50_06275 [Luteolibacter sp.]|uniref:hypothetical protein n=1 Tax=Luteolibacter sp. TaxID=1962973 RepID=UPI0032639F80
MNGPGDRSSEVHDFREILSNRVDGQLPLLVGGHAVNLWALSYQQRIGREMDKWLPLTSKDLDLFGTLALLDGMKERFGGTYRLSGPRSPVVGQLVVTLAGVERQIDVLRDVYGLRRQELAGDAVTLEINTDGETHAIRVLPVIPLLQAKVANLANLDQTNRNDFKHVNLMLLVVRESLAELIGAAESKLLDSRAAIVPLEQVLKIIASSDAMKCIASHEIDFDGIWPRDLLIKARDSRLQNFVKHRLPQRV